MLSLPSKLEGLRRQQRHSLATLWRIERTDGEVFRFTDHDEAITFNDEVYEVAGGLESTAKQLQEGLNTRNFESRGIINSDKITLSDLRAGRFREAAVLEYLVDWRYPFVGAFYETQYWIGDISFDGVVWNAQMQDISRWLRLRVGDVYTRNCRWTLGDAKCGKSLGPFTHTGTVSSIVTQRLTFNSNVSYTNNEFAFGKLTWLTGANAGLISEVRSSLNSGGRIYLQLSLPFDITVGDTFSVISGCDKTFATCKSKFANGTRFGGFPHIPGTEKLIVTPNAR